jgi:hypothetical protein
MILSQIRRLPRPVPVHLPRMRIGALGRRHREVALAQLLPLLATVCLLCAALWGVAQHAAQRAELRLAETERHLEQFEAPPVADAWQRLTEAWQAEMHRQHALLAKIASLSGARRDEALRDYQRFVLEVVEEHRLQPEIETLLGFVKRLALCVRLGSCDRQVAAARLGDALHRFRNQHHYYLALELPEEQLDQYIDEIDGARLDGANLNGR